MGLHQIHDTGNCSGEHTKMGKYLWTKWNPKPKTWTASTEHCQSLVCIYWERFLDSPPPPVSIREPFVATLGNALRSSALVSPIRRQLPLSTSVGRCFSPHISALLDCIWALRIKARQMTITAKIALVLLMIMGHALECDRLSLYHFAVLEKH